MLVDANTIVCMKADEQWKLKAISTMLNMNNEHVVTAVHAI